MINEFTNEFKVTQTVPAKKVIGLLCTAFEGGSNYWYAIESVFIPPELDQKEFSFGGKYYPMELGQHWTHTYLAPFVPGGYLMIADLLDERGTDDNPIQYKLDLQALQMGLKIMNEKYPVHFADMMSEEDDATTGDVFLQCCLFGEIQYS